MRGLFESLKMIWRTHQAVRIVSACVLGASTVGAAGAGIYTLVNDTVGSDDAVVEEVEVQEEAAAEDVYIPNFQSIVLTSESLEKDLTIYISDEDDDAITGVPFSVKLLTKEKAEGLQTYIDDINAINDKIAEITGEETADKEDSSEEKSEDKTTEKKDEATEKTEEKAEESSDKAEGSEDTDTQEAKPTEADKMLAILQDRNVPVTVTDENGEVVETQKSSIKEDPLYQLYLDKETAIQSFAMALKEADGTVYTDDDEDGVIEQKDMEPGDYVACVMYDFDNQALYDPATFATDVNVKDKVEFKVQKEITKQIKKDVASEDNQPKEITPVEEALKDTMEYVPSSKSENGSGSVKSITGANITAPKSTVSASKATRKDGAKTSVTHEVKGKEHKITIHHVYYMEDGTTVNSSKPEEVVTETKAEGAAYEYTAKSGDGIECISNPDNRKGTVGNQDIVITFKYKKVKTQAEKDADAKAEADKKAAEEKAAQEKAEAEKKAEEEAKKAEEEAKKKAEEEAKKAEEEKKKQEEQNQGDNNAGDENKPGEGDDSNGQDGAYRKNNSKKSSMISPMNAVAANNRYAFVAAKVRKWAAANTTTEKATLDMSYSGGVFTINASSNVGSVSVNGTSVALNGGKGTFTATKDGDYKLTGVATFSDGYKDNSLVVVYTVSGYGAASTEQLKDKEGHPLFLDEGLTKPATAADYGKDKTYYFKQPGYTYYGWQSLDGATYYFDKNGNKATGEQVIQGVKYNFGPDGALLVKGNGIDVSKYQGNIDWNQAKSAVSFAIIRCGYRGQNDGQLHEDPYFYKNMKGAKSAGVATGIYIFSRALNEAEAVQEASMAVAMAQKAGGCAYPIYIDMEDTTRGVNRLSNAQRNAIVNAFCSTVQSSGYKAGLYCSRNWMNTKMDAGSITGSAYIWIAQYNTTCTYKGKYSMWQYSSKGSVPGIKGNVDMNRSYF